MTFLKQVDIMTGPESSTRAFEIPGKVKPINYLTEVRDESGFYVNRLTPSAVGGHFSKDLHPQVEVYHPDGTFALVDEGMAEVVVGLWALGVDTSFSCQGPEQRYLVVRRPHRFVARSYLDGIGEVVFRDEPGGHLNTDSWYFRMLSRF